MFAIYSGESADQIWNQLALRFCEPAGTSARQSRAGPTKDIGNAAITLTNPLQKWVVSRRPALNPAFALAEVVWIVNGRNDARFLNYFNKRLPEFAGRGDTYSGAYGYRLRKHFGLDQLERAYRALLHCDYSRQVVLSTWDSRTDFPSEDGSPRSPDVPCNLASLLKIRDNALEWTQLMRSSDLFLGIPHNLVQFTSLQEIIAGWLGLNLGHFNLVTDCMHVYERDFLHLAETEPSQIPVNSDSLALAKSQSERIFSDLERLVEGIIDTSIGAPQLLKLCDQADLPTSYSHILRVLLAEGLRRRGEREEAEAVMEHCTNPILRRLWANWNLRFLSNSVRTQGGS